MRQKIRKGLLTYSAILFPLLFFFLSPFIIVMSALHGIINGSAVIFGLLLLFSVFGSRLFCGWLCPGGALQEQVSNINSRPWNSRWRNASKYIIWIVWLTFIIFLWCRRFPLKVNFFYMSEVNLFIVIIYFIVATLIYACALLTGKRGMCHSICWMAPFMVLGEKIADFLHIPRFRLTADGNACISCKKCNKQCPMSLDVHGMVKSGQMDSTECISCLECVDCCPKGAIACGIKRTNSSG
ncbi:4Fe-4S binding protein [Clostridium sp. Marseille-P2415]|uniref:4Fe-4S binding protein n=1 Tax=Clostridium sp. Marseille-P2415 TaxID=1805471 RepID=UPI0009884182|nr:4Fe-4S binding protein [Clostridium sp. Marseille-P2415]